MAGDAPAVSSNGARGHAVATLLLLLLHLRRGERGACKYVCRTVCFKAVPPDGLGHVRPIQCGTLNLALHKLHVCAHHRVRLRVLFVGLCVCMRVGRVRSDQALVRRDAARHNTHATAA